MDDRKSTIAKASAWAFAGQLTVKFLPPLTNMILARIFAPSVFGIVTTVTMITSFAEMLTEGGFSRYLIRNDYKSATELKKDADVAFWTNLSISVFLWICILLFRNALSSILSGEDISLIIVVASLQLPITSFSTIHSAIVQREYNFKKIFLAQFVSSVANLVITLALAWVNMGVWSIIYANLIGYIIRFIIYSINSNWHPGFYFSFSRLGKMWSFSMWVYFETIAVWFTSWADSFFVGSRLSKHNLGIYKNSQSMVNGVLSIPQYSVSNILYVTLSKDIGNKRKFDSDFLYAQRLLAYILFPVGFGILLYKEFAVRIVFGSGWDDAILVIASWSLASVFRVIYMSITSPVYISQGKAKYSLYLQFIDFVILVPTCVIFIQAGFEKFVIIRSVVRVAIIPINLILMQKVCAINANDIINNTIKPLLISVCMFIIGNAIKCLLPNTIVMCIVGIVGCIGVYSVLFVLVSPDDFIEIKKIVGGFLKKIG